MNRYIITLYKFYKKDNCDTRVDAFDYTDILTESELRTEFINEFKNFDKRVLEKYSIKEKDLLLVDDIDIHSIIDIFQENDSYDDKNQHYYIQLIQKKVDDYNDLNSLD